MNPTFDKPQSEHVAAPIQTAIIPATPLLKTLLEKSLIHREDWEKLSDSTRGVLLQETEQSAVLYKLVEHELLTRYQAGRIEAGTTHGMILGSYRVLNRLGAGGMGIVFLAEHIRLRRLVAIKVLPLVRDESSNSLLVRFFTEIRAVAQLQHPNIVWAIDTGELPSEDPNGPVLYYHVMEFVPGKNLEEMIQTDGPLSLENTCDIAFQVASALAEANRHKLVHRDIKPSNILITPEGKAKLLDFGIALNFHHRHTQPGIVMGSLEFLAPEQASDSSAVDIRADIFGLGATMYWCLTGRVPFPSDKNVVQQLMSRLTQAPPALVQLRPDVPEELNDIIAKMMATNRDDRIATPQDVMRALLPFLPGAPGAVRPQDLAPAPITRPALHVTNVEAAARRQRVLVVDDEEAIRMICRSILEAQDIQCDEADDGERALEAVRHHPYDLVLLDIQLPKVSGRDVLRQLRDQPPGANLKIVMMSGGTSGDEMSVLLLAGADDYLAKPFSPMQMNARIATALRLKSAQDRSDALTARLLRVNQELDHALQSKDSDLVRSRNALALALAELVAYRGGETAAHLERIQRYVRILAEDAARGPAFSKQLDKNYILLLEGCAPLHDFGMIVVPEHLINRPGKLAPDERIIIQSHTSLGAEIIQNVAKKHAVASAFFQISADLVRHHHERWDGQGYPDRLAGAAIPLSARILALADVYDALRSRRAHKPALTHTATMQLMTEESPGQFDPALLTVLRGCHQRLEAVFQEIRD